MEAFYQDVFWPLGKLAGQLLELLVVGCHHLATPVDGFDADSRFVLGEWIFESLAEGHHELIEAWELWHILIFEGDHHSHAPEFEFTSPATCGTVTPSPAGPGMG